MAQGLVQGQEEEQALLQGAGHLQVAGQEGQLEQKQPQLQQQRVEDRIPATVGLGDLAGLGFRLRIRPDIGRDSRLWFWEF